MVLAWNAHIAVFPRFQKMAFSRLYDNWKCLETRNNAFMIERLDCDDGGPKSFKK